MPEVSLRNYNENLLLEWTNENGVEFDIELLGNRANKTLKLKFVEELYKSCQKYLDDGGFFKDGTNFLNAMDLYVKTVKQNSDD